MIINVATGRTRGYHGSKPDRALLVNGKPWAEVRKEGGVADWYATDDGALSVLTLGKGTSIVVDFTGKSGAEAMLATTCKAKEGKKIKVGKHRVTLLFPGTAEPPEVKVEGNEIRVGKRRLTVKGRTVDVPR